MDISKPKFDFLKVANVNNFALECKWTSKFSKYVQNLGFS